MAQIATNFISNLAASCTLTYMAYNSHWLRIRRRQILTKYTILHRQSQKFINMIMSIYDSELQFAIIKPILLIDNHFTQKYFAVLTFFLSVAILELDV